MPDEPARPAMPDEPAWPAPPDEPGAVRSAAPEGEQPTEVSFRVDGRMTALRITGAVIFLLLALAFHDDPGRVLFGGIAGLLCAAYAARDLIAPSRLAADAEGVTVVSGLRRSRRLGWEQIELVRHDQRRRFGARTELLEIDSGDNLYLFSGYDLGVPCWRAAQTLAALAPPR
jgi:Bacterial PH domain